MLRSRVLTSIVLASIVVVALLALAPAPLTIVLAAMFLGIGGWESARLAGFNGAVAAVVWIALLFAAGVGLVLALHHERGPAVIFGSAAPGWLLLSAWLAFPEVGRPRAARPRQPAKLLVSGAILLAGFAAIAWLHAANPWWVIALIGVIAAADIGAYFSGHRFGGARLAPRISPGKTWSGAFGGLGLAALTAATVALFVEGPAGPGTAAAAALVLAALSIAGDLVFSLMKRHRGLKDTSALLPGHGGLLDRIDGLLAAAPAFALLVLAVG